MSKKELSKRMKTLIEKHGEDVAYEMLKGWGKVGGSKKVPKGFAITGDAKEKSDRALAARWRKHGVLPDDFEA